VKITQEPGGLVPAPRARPVPIGDAGPHAETTAKVTARRTASRLALWAGVAAGTALVVLAEWNGVHPRIGGMPHWAGYAAGFAAVWLAAAGLAAWAAELLRRHHQALASGAWRHGRRGALAAARRARRHGGALAGRVNARAGARWASRGDTWRAPLLLTRRPADGGQHQGVGDQACDSGDDARPQAGSRDRPDGEPPAARPHSAPAGGAADPASAPAPAAATRNREATMTATRAVPAYWHQVACATADFHPDSDAELLDWMSAEVAGMLGYGEALAELHEHCVTAVRADPAAMAALHDVADAAADCAEAMARAMDKFRQVYEAPREFVADGGVLPKDGDWLQGDDET